MLRKNYQDHYLAIVWDGGYTARLDLTKLAKANKIIPELYKENRKGKPTPPAVINLEKQKPELRGMLSSTNIPQIVMPGEEADDVVASYAKRYASSAQDIVLYTNDKDYFQLLRGNIRGLIGDKLYDEHLFAAMKGVTPQQWTDVGGLEGDDGDNIFGVPGWGEKTSIEKIKEFGTLENLFAAYHKELDPLRQTYPDLQGEGFKELKSLKTPSGAEKYPEVYPHMPFTGVALALEKKLVKKPKVMVSALMFEERARLAKVLKTMRADLDIPDLPGWNGTPAWNRQKKDEFIKYCSKYRLNEVLVVSELLCAPQT